jgi:hypothetical protein
MRGGRRGRGASSREAGARAFRREPRPVHRALLQTSIHFLVFPPHVRAPPDPAAIPHLFVSKLLAWPLLGHAAADVYGTWAASLSPEGFAMTAGGMAVAIVALVVGLVAFSRRDSTTRALVVTWLAAAGGYLLLGLDVGRAHLPVVNGGRYAFLPSLLLILLLGHQLAGAEPRRRTLRRVVFGVPLAATVMVGISEYRYPPDVARWMHGQPWLAEVHHFRENPEYDHLHIAPAAWVVVIPWDAP